MHRAYGPSACSVEKKRAITPGTKPDVIRFSLSYGFLGGGLGRTVDPS